MTHIVSRNFTDKTDGKQYSVGQSFQSQDQGRVTELEQGGFIVNANSQAAEAAFNQGQANQTAKQQGQQMAEAYSQAAKAAEPKTVINGKVVPLKYAQAAEASLEESITQSGIREAHNNASEPVQAGAIAQDTTQAHRAELMEQREQMQAVKAADIQSGQQELEQHMNQAQQGMNQQNMNQQNQDQHQQQAQAAAHRAKETNPAEASADIAAQEAKAASEAKARAKKGQ